VWLNLGHVEKTIGNQAAAIEAYRRAAALDPATGEAWWSLANLKTVRLDKADIAAMRAALPHDAWATSARGRGATALRAGQGLRGRGAGRAGLCPLCARQRAAPRGLDYDPARTEAAVADAALFTAPFLAERAGWGCPAPDPIFVVGLPRSGSTLVEQILASHSQIEGTMELPDMMLIADRLQARVEEGEFPIWRRAHRAGAGRLPPSGRGISSARAFTARPTGPSSSTRCPTTGSIWA
jgi:hypothetical protein